MKRPGVAEKKLVDPDLEPDFYKISEMLPVPGAADEESIFLQKTLQSGPKARMPIITGHFKNKSSSNNSDAVSVSSSEDTTVAPTTVSPQPSTTMPPTSTVSTRRDSLDVPSMPAIAEATVTPEGHDKNAAVVNPLLFQMPMPALDGKDSAASSSFAAGFAAATAHYQQHFFNMMSKMAESNQLPAGFNPANMAA